MTKRVASLPSRSVRPSTRVVDRALADLIPASNCIASARSISRGKSTLRSSSDGVPSAGVPVRERTVDGTAPAVEAFVDHLILVGRGHSSGVAIVVAIDHLEQRRERRAQRDALLAPVADLEDAAEFATHLRLVEVRRIAGVVDARHAR